MAFLTPLYLLAGLAVGLPVLFHLIRRTPKGRQVFSSLMFLQPSPPKVTKRSRIEDWLLLLLRALAVCLLAIAFSRPFLRTQDKLSGEQKPGRRVVILIDTSASMQRDGMWEEAISSVEETLASLKPSDALSLLRFDSETNQLIGFTEWIGLDLELRNSTVLELAQKLQPTSSATELGKAMITAADLLEEHADEQVTGRKLFVISDFQSGSHWETLNSYEWPEGVDVEILNVDARNQPTNASVQLVGNESATDNAIRLRVNNSGNAEQELFEITWLDQFSKLGEVKSDQQHSVNVYVPPGQSKVIHAPERPTTAIPQRLVITGDQQKFDNTCFVAPLKPWHVNIAFIGDNATAGPDSLRFFLDPLFPSTSKRDITIYDWKLVAVEPPVSKEELTLLIIGGAPNESQLKWSREWLAGGGKILFVATNPKQAAVLYDLLEVAPQPVTEADVIDYTMLRSVDFTHPVFAPFDDPRFADFSKLRFWKHREFDLASLPEAEVLATFEEDSPAFFELAVEQGRIVVFTSGWNRSDSELAVWSKFVPMMNGLLEYLGEQRSFQPVYTVGDDIVPVAFGFREKEIFVKSPGGETASFSVEKPYTLNDIGIYTIAASEDGLTADVSLRFAVNLPPDESKTDPLSMDLLAAAGVPVDSKIKTPSKSETDAASQRQLLNRELESKQQLWKWLLATALLVLLLEIAIAGDRQRKTSVVAQVN